MACYIKVAENENSTEFVEVPTEDNGSLLLSSVTAQFPGATGLRFKASNGKYRGCRVTDNTIDPPLDGWNSAPSYVVVKQASKRSAQDKGGTEQPAGKSGRMSEAEITAELMIAGLPYTANENDVRSHFASFGELETFEIIRESNGTMKGFGYIKYNNVESVKAVFTSTHKFGDKKVEVHYSKRAPRVMAMKQQKQQDQQEQEISSLRLFVGRLPDSTTSMDLHGYFKQFGPLKDVYIPTPFKNFGFVLYNTQADCDRVVAMEHKFKGALLNVCYANHDQGRRHQLHQQPQQHHQHHQQQQHQQKQRQQELDREGKELSQKIKQLPPVIGQFDSNTAPVGQRQNTSSKGTIMLAQHKICWSKANNIDRNDGYRVSYSKGNNGSVVSTYAGMPGTTNNTISKNMAPNINSGNMASFTAGNNNVGNIGGFNGNPMNNVNNTGFNSANSNIISNNTFNNTNTGGNVNSFNTSTNTAPTSTAAAGGANSWNPWMSMYGRMVQTSYSANPWMGATTIPTPPWSTAQNSTAQNVTSVQNTTPNIMLQQQPLQQQQPPLPPPQQNQQRPPPPPPPQQQILGQQNTMQQFNSQPVNNVTQPIFGNQQQSSMVQSNNQQLMMNNNSITAVNPPMQSMNMSQLNNQQNMQPNIQQNTIQNTLQPNNNAMQHNIMQQQQNTIQNNNLIQQNTIQSTTFVQQNTIQNMPSNPLPNSNLTNNMNNPTIMQQNVYASVPMGVQTTFNPVSSLNVIKPAAPPQTTGFGGYQGNGNYSWVPSK